MDRHAKIRKLFGKSGLVRNVSHLAETLHALQDLTDEERDRLLCMSRQDLSRSIDEPWEQVRVDLELKWLTNGLVYHLPCISFSKAMQFSIDTALCFGDMLQRMYDTRPCTEASPYSLILYADEIVPGNVLNLDYPRKTLVMRSSIKEYGPAVLKSACVWLPLVMIRTNICKNLIGGGGSVWTALLKQLFLVEKISTDGLVLTIRGVSNRWFFQVTNFLLDGDAVRMMFGCKAVRAKMPCVGCLNVTSDLALVGDGLVSLQTCDMSAFEFASDDDLWAKADALEEASKGKKSALKRLEMALGLNYSPEAFLWCKALRPHVRPAMCLTFDQMHILLSQGLADIEYESILPKLISDGVSWDDIHNFCSAAWQTPKTFSRYAKTREAFSLSKRRHWQCNKRFSLSAGEHISLMPIFLHFLETIVAKTHPGRFTREIQSFRCLTTVVALVKEGKLNASGAEQLERACVARSLAHHRAYPNASLLVLKPHWLLHLPRQLRRDGFTLDCFVGERGNSSIKSCAATLENTSSFESSLCKRMLVHTTAGLRALENASDHLVKPKYSVFVGGPASKAMVYGGVLLSAGDVAIVGDQFFIMVCFFLPRRHLPYVGVGVGSRGRNHTVFVPVLEDRRGPSHTSGGRASAFRRSMVLA